MNHTILELRVNRDPKPKERTFLDRKTTFLSLAGGETRTTGLNYWDGRWDSGRGAAATKPSSPNQTSQPLNIPIAIESEDEGSDTQEEEEEENEEDEEDGDETGTDGVGDKYPSDDEDWTGKSTDKGVRVHLREVLFYDHKVACLERGMGNCNPLHWSIFDLLSSPFSWFRL
ncbi:hypothetical protein B9Z19DRAFT_1123683 [Tuber borchii]|uniref:Uncharacterized protein n=1 Tax=Tuber borchii TaxID=42251 RepID=A0A2T6ZY49_TUBBO|nr:hypothetical protein B9Z19DRAFT_1123683 [Tuber borchii]